MTTNTPEAIWEKIQKGVFIIAEAGKNFIQTEEERPVAEYLENAKRLVDEAVKAGADAIKWQTHNVEDEQLDLDIVYPHFKGADRFSWVTRNTEATPFTEFWKPLKAYCDQKGIIFMSTPMGRGAAKVLNETGVSVWKVGSGDILDFVMLDYLRESGKPVMISSGMSTFEEVKKALNYLLEKNDRVALFHALSKYPGRLDEANLAVMEFYREKFPGVPVGFSENSISIESCLFATALGAKMIERHLTISRDLWGADHRICSIPEEFKELVDGIRRIEKEPAEREGWLGNPNLKIALGKKEKILQKDEELFRPLFRKALMAGCDIPAGTALTADMIYAMRPQQYAGGLPSEEYENMLGKKTMKGLKKYDPITRETIG